MHCGQKYHKISVLFKLIKQNVNYSKSAWATKSGRFNNYKETKVDLVAEALEVITVDKPNDWAKVQEFILNNQLNYRKSYNEMNIDSFIMRYALKKYFGMITPYK